MGSDSTARPAMAISGHTQMAEVGEGSQEPTVGATSQQPSTEEVERKKEMARRASKMALSQMRTEVSNATQERQEGGDRFSCASCMVVNARNGVRKTFAGRRYDGRAFFLFGVFHPLRKRVIDVVENEWWDRLVLLVVLANCVTTAVKDPLAAEALAWQQVSEWVFIVIFSAEMAVKMLAMGFTPLESTHCYLSEGWNILDAVIVLSSWVSQLLSDGSFSALRTFRVLRPLRTISRVRGMRILVRSLLASLPSLRDVVLLFLFFVTGFAILGVEIFRGRLHYRCFDAQLGLLAQPTGVCTCPNVTVGIASGILPPQSMDDTGAYGCTDACSTGEVCLYTPINPNAGASGFDTVFDAFLSIFQAVSLEGWSDFLHQLAVSSPIASPIYFIALVVFGAFFVMNLYVVVMCESYLRTRETLEELERVAAIAEAEAKQENKARRLASKRGPTIVETLSRVLGKVLAVLRRATNRVHTRLPGWAPMRKLVELRFFDMGMVFLIIANTLTLAMDFYGDGATNAYVSGMQLVNYVFTVAFFIEMVLRIIAYGPVGYCSDSMNIFDATVVAFSVIESVATLASVTGDSGGVNVSGFRALRLFRAFRLLRAFKLARSFRSLRLLLRTVVYSITQARDLGLLLLLAIFIFALLGMECFAGSFGTCSGTVPANISATARNLYSGCTQAGFEWHAEAESFDDLGSSVMTVIVVMVGENWNTIWHSAFGTFGWLSSIFFVATLVTGNFMLLNLLLGIILGSSSMADTADDDEESPEAKRKYFAARRRAARKRLVQMKRAGVLEQFAEELRDKIAKDEVLTARDGTPDQDPGKDPGKERSAAAPATSDVAAVSEQTRMAPLSEESSVQKEWFPPKSLVGRARGRVRFIVAHWAFETITLVLIVLSSITLALDDPGLPADSPLSQTLQVLDAIFAIAFTIEGGLLMFAHGVLRKGGYLRTGWNVVDFIVVLVSWIAIILRLSGADQAGGVEALRALRALRPIRIVHHVPSMRTVVLSIFQALPACATIAGLLFFFLLLFSILGIQFFGGTFGQCVDASILTRDACRLAGHRWYNPDMGNFDNVFTAMILLFEMLTTEMWPDVLHLCSDATSPYHAPAPGASIWWARMFCVAWIFVGALFIGNLFVGVLIDNFQSLFDDEEGRSLVSPSQMAWIIVQRSVVAMRALRRPPRPPAAKQPRRAKVYDFVTSSRFERAVAVLTVVNAALLATTYYGEPEWLSFTTTMFNFGFVALWAMEAGLKLFGFGTRTYFSFAWNRFDFALVLCGLVEVVIFAVQKSLDTPEGLATVATLVRLTRLLRLVRVVQAIPPLRNLLHTLVQSLPSLGAVVSLMVLVFFVYALLGVQLFHKVIHGEFINENVNFESFPIAMLTLLIASTGESWNGMMHDLMVQPEGVDWLAAWTGGAPRLPVCAMDPQVGVDDCGTWGAVPYFVTFQLICFCLLLNAAIAVLLAHFANDASEAFITRTNLIDFSTEWSKFDPLASRVIPATGLPVILRHVSAPLGVQGNQKKAALFRVLRHLSEGPHKLNLHRGQFITYHEVLMSLSARHFGSVSLKGGLGETRFALQHEAETRAAVRMSVSAALLRGTRGNPTAMLTAHRLKSQRIKTADTAVSSRSPYTGTLVELHAAHVLQASWKGHVHREQRKKKKKKHGAGVLGVAHPLPSSPRDLALEA